MIDYKILHFFFYIETMHNLLIFARFQEHFQNDGVEYYR